MAAYITTCLLIASTVVCARAGVDQCPTNLSRTRNLMQFFSSCYEYHLGRTKSWKEADKICKAGGGYLVSINSASEQASVFNGLQLLNSNEDVWIGLSDHITADNWQWSSGQPLTYKNWAPGQPGMAGSLEDCALMKHGDSGHWHDYPCDDILFLSYNYNFICEYPIV